MAIIPAAIPHVYTFSEWSEFPLWCGFTDTTYSFESPDDVLQNTVLIEKMPRALYQPFFPKQIHSNTVFTIDEPRTHTGEMGDGVITTIIGFPLGVLTADCVPLFFYCKEKHIVGIAHAGWKGLGEGIIHAMMHLFFKRYGIDAQDIAVSLGPAIRACCYEVQDNVADHFPYACTQREGRIYLDLPLVIRRQLVGYGIPDTALSDSAVCTHCGIQNFFSYRRDKTTFRMASFIMLRDVTT